MDDISFLGREYSDGELIIRQGERAERMFIVQEGRVELVREESGIESQLAVCKQGQLFGVSPLFDGGYHMAHARAMGSTRLITISRKNLLRRIHEDPSLAFHIIEILSQRLHKLTIEAGQKPDNKVQS
jgi:CRP-like cAMP-binding protein